MALSWLVGGGGTGHHMVRAVLAEYLRQPQVADKAAALSAVAGALGQI